MPIEIDGDRREQLVVGLQKFFLNEFDEELSRFRAEKVFEFVSAALGPRIYNQAVQDARRFMQQRLDDLDGEVYQPEAG